MVWGLSLGLGITLLDKARLAPIGWLEKVLVTALEENLV